MRNCQGSERSAKVAALIRNRVREFRMEISTNEIHEVVSAMNYLTEFGRSAQLDLARHRIQSNSNVKAFPSYV